MAGKDVGKDFKIQVPDSNLEEQYVRAVSAKILKDIAGKTMSEKVGV